MLQGGTWHGHHVFVLHPPRPGTLTPAGAAGLLPCMEVRSIALDRTIHARELVRSICMPMVAVPPLDPSVINPASPTEAKD